MEKIQIAYNLRIKGLKFPMITFANVTPEFKNIILKPIESKEGYYELLINKNISSTNTHDLNPIFEESTLEAEKFIYIFSISADIKIFEFECKGYYQKERFITIHQAFKNGSTFSVFAKPTVIDGESSVTKIKDKMKNNYNLALLQMYYDSATIIEPIGRFIALYSFLLYKNSDSQKKVDEAILYVDATVSQFRSPHKKNTYETIFTKLRNELSHKRDGVNILKTHNEIKLHIKRFEDIIKI